MMGFPHFDPWAHIAGDEPPAKVVKSAKAAKSCGSPPAKALRKSCESAQRTGTQSSDEGTEPEGAGNFRNAFAETSQSESRRKPEHSQLSQISQGVQNGTTIPLDAEGVPCAFCRACGHRGFWQLPDSVGPWRCQACEPPPRDRLWSACWVPDPAASEPEAAKPRLDLLCRANSAAAPDPDTFEERAAIAEHDGRVPRCWTEGLVRLCTMPPPTFVPPARWQTFIDDCAWFGDNWAATAAALGWGPLDLWGCDPRKPFARLDKQGLCWLLNGRELVALTADQATIRTASGTALSYYRHSDGEPERVVLAWELEKGQT